MAENEKNYEQEKQERYLEAERARYAAERRPSKLHEMPLICYIQEGDKLYPVYRREE